MWQEALTGYREEVQARVFPSPQHTPYKLAAQEADALAASLKASGFMRAAHALERQAAEA